MRHSAQEFLQPGCWTALFRQDGRHPGAMAAAAAGIQNNTRQRRASTSSTVCAYSGARRIAPWLRSEPMPSWWSAPGHSLTFGQPLFHTGAGPGGEVQGNGTRARGMRPAWAWCSVKPPGRFREQAFVEAALQHVLGHGPVGGPFAAGDGHEPIGVGDDGVFPRQRLGGALRILRRGHQRAAGPPRRFARLPGAPGAQRSAGFDRMKSSSSAKGCGLARQILTRGVGGTQHHLAQPGHSKQHATVRRLGHQQGMFTGRNSRSTTTCTPWLGLTMR
jgi:hypothetical protein